MGTSIPNRWGVCLLVERLTFLLTTCFVNILHVFIKGKRLSWFSVVSFLVSIKYLWNRMRLYLEFALVCHVLKFHSLIAWLPTLWFILNECSFSWLMSRCYIHLCYINSKYFNNRTIISCIVCIMIMNHVSS